MIINGVIATVPSFRYIRAPEKIYEQLTSLLAQS